KGMISLSPPTICNSAENTVKPSIHAASASLLGELLINILNCDRVQIHTHKKTSSLALERFLADLITINYEAQKK
ncbi:TPA: hypothetical protein ACQ719_004766, partial [Escherichia coli]